MGTSDEIDGIEVRELSQVLPALKKAQQNQKKIKSTIIEIHMTPEVTPIFRADAMEKPYRFLDKYHHLSTGKKPF